ncbi:hypothetical protein [Maribacter halichondriae]|uniref:hypothetical protein n=1 Tax=Maribacter halichondriae TaxID=2980554 RepID=UPI002359DFA1|nr:hypothetical protein [Maribacter sp. Hal144]
MKNYFLFLVLTCFISVAVNGQRKTIQPWGVSGDVWDHSKALGNNPSSENFYSDMRMKFAKMGEEVKLTLDDIEGTIYIDGQFSLGTLFIEGKAFKKLQLRFDAYNDEMELKESAASEEVKALVKDPGLSCSLNGRTFIYTTMIGKNDTRRSGYLIPLYEGKSYRFYERKIKDFKEGKQARTSHGTSFPHRFVDENEFYITRKDDDIPEILPAKKSEIISIFGMEKEKTIKKFIRAKKIDVSKVGDLVNLFAYVNTLY